MFYGTISFCKSENQNKSYMKKTLLTVSLLFLLCGISYSQITNGSLLSTLLDHYTLNFQSVENAGRGFTGIGSKGSLLSSALNPASPDFEKHQIYAEYNFKSVPDNLPGFKQFQPLFSAGFGYSPVKDLHLGVLYRNDRGFRITDSYTTYNFVNHTLSFPVNYRYKYLRFGINLNVTQYHYSYKSETSTIYDEEANEYTFLPEIGIAIDPDESFSLGLVFSPKVEQDVEITGTNLSNPEHSKIFYPMRFGAGAEFRIPDENLKFLFDYRFEKLSDYKMFSTYDEATFNDRHNFHLGAEYKPEKNLTLRAGFFTMLALTSEIKNFDRVIDDEYFFTLGAGYGYRNFKFNFAYLNSAVIRITDVSHQAFNFGVIYDF